jgi:hypothetical protein
MSKPAVVTDAHIEPVCFVFYSILGQPIVDPNRSVNRELLILDHSISLSGLIVVLVQVYLFFVIDHY